MNARGRVAEWLTEKTREHLRWRLKDSLEDWFLEGLLWQHSIPQSAPQIGVYYEFGVGDGRSAAAYARAAQRFCNKTGEELSQFHICGFDSFEGLPPSDLREDQHPDWAEGVYRHSPEAAAQKIGGTGFPEQNLHLIEGFYEDSLTDEIRTQIPADPSIVMIDCDLYSSTITALRWLAPSLSSGTLFYFDDLWAFHGHPDYGEKAAIRDAQLDPSFGYMTPFPLLGSADRAFVFARHVLEF